SGDAPTGRPGRGRANPRRKCSMSSPTDPTSPAPTPAGPTTPSAAPGPPAPVPSATDPAPPAPTPAPTPPVPSTTAQPTPAPGSSEQVRCANPDGGHLTPKGQKSCGECGLSLEPTLPEVIPRVAAETVRKTIGELVKDRKVVELETAVAVADRVWLWS